MSAALAEPEPEPGGGSGGGEPPAPSAQRREALRFALDELGELMSGELARRLAYLQERVAFLERRLPPRDRLAVLAEFGSLLDPDADNRPGPGGA